MTNRKSIVKEMSKPPANQLVKKAENKDLHPYSTLLVQRTCIRTQAWNPVFSLLAYENMEVEICKAIKEVSKMSNKGALTE